MPPDSWTDVRCRWERGGTVRANLEDVARANAARVEYAGGELCPEHCGSIIRYRKGRPRREAVQAHVRDPAACWRHPERRGSDEPG